MVKQPLLPHTPGELRLQFRAAHLSTQCKLRFSVVVKPDDSAAAAATALRDAVESRIQVLPRLESVFIATSMALSGAQSSLAWVRWREAVMLPLAEPLSSQFARVCSLVSYPWRR